MELLTEEREAVAAACRRLAAAGLVRGTSGNVSVRRDELIAVTPTGARLATLTPGEVAVVDRRGAHVEGPLAPTSELDLHRSVYERYESGAVVHTHAPAATAVACVATELPCLHYEMLLLGGDVRVAPYSTFGTQALADGAVVALEGRTAALLANHGTVTHGAALGAAIDATELLEWAADLYLRAAAAGTPRALTDQQRQAVVDVATERAYGETRAV